MDTGAADAASSAKAIDAVIRVLHLIKSLGRGGAEMLLSEGLQFTDRERFTYEYAYFLPWKNALVESLQKQDVEVTCLNRRSSASILLSARRLARFIRERKFDLVHCHLPIAGIAGRLACKSSRIPVVYTEHNVMQRYHAWTRRLNLLTWKYQRCVIAVSNEVRSSIHAYAGNAVPVTVIPNGISIDTYRHSEEGRVRVRQHHGIPLSAPVIGTVAVLRSQKDLPTWFRAAKQILHRHPDARFLIVGAGQMEQELKAESEKLGLSAVLFFTGLQQDVVPFLSAMDIYMSSSLFEGMPLSVLEAMSMELPVIATSVGGLPEVVLDKKTGFLVPPRTPEALAECAMQLISQPELRTSFGKAGRKDVEHRFSIRRMMQQLENLYLQVLSGN